MRRKLEEATIFLTANYTTKFRAKQARLNSGRAVVTAEEGMISFIVEE
jgi:hypothetical protein